MSNLAIATRQCEAMMEVCTASVLTSDDSRTTGLCPSLLDRHPVLRASPVSFRDAVGQQGRLRRVPSGDRVELEGTVGFLLVGSLAVFDCKDIACVNLLGPGSTFGWEASLARGHGAMRLLTLVDSEWIEIPATVPQAIMGTGWVERMFARHALDRMLALQTFSACNAAHPVPRRVANLIRRLSRGSDADVRITQAALAQAVGVQRTSVNASIKDLERTGAIAIWRSRIRVKCPATLARVACGC